MCRLEGSYGRETANSGAVADVATMSAQHLSSMQAALQTAVDAQRQRAADAVASLEAFVQQSMSDVTSLKVTAHVCHFWTDKSSTSSLPALQRAMKGHTTTEAKPESSSVIRDEVRQRAMGCNLASPAQFVSLKSTSDTFYNLQDHAGELREQVIRLKGASSASIDKAASAGTADFASALAQSRAFGESAEQVHCTSQKPILHTSSSFSPLRCKRHCKSL